MVLEELFEIGKLSYYFGCVCNAQISFESRVSSGLALSSFIGQLPQPLCAD